MNQTSENSVEDVLRVELAEGDAMIGTLSPILRHLLTTDNDSLFSDATIARVRGMIESLARQLLHAHAVAAAIESAEDFVEERLDPLADALVGYNALLSHLHALTIEWQLAERLHSRNAVDPILSPLLQGLIASSDADTAAAAMTALAAQARFIQGLRRMELLLTELPGDIFHDALLSLTAMADAADAGSAQTAEAALRTNFDESRSRVGLIARLVTGMGEGAIAALSVDHSGVAMFLTALSINSGQERDLTILSTSDRQLARLALALRAAGLKPAAVEEQFVYLHPDFVLPEGFEHLRADRAAALLSAAPAYLGQ